MPSSRDDFANNQWQAYAGYGPASNNNGTHGAALPQNLFTGSFGTARFHQRLCAAATNLPPNVLAFNAYSVLNYLQGLGNPADHDHSRLQCRLLQSGLYRHLSRSPMWPAPIPR